MAIIKDVVMVQGHGVIGMVQLGSVVFVFGDNKEKGNTGPNWELVLFRPYSKEWFHFKTRRGFMKRLVDIFTL